MSNSDRYQHAGGPSSLPKMPHDLKSWEEALNNGLDPNTVWSEINLPASPGTYSHYSIQAGPPPLDDEAWPHWNRPLHRAVWGSNHKSADLLLQHGADINQHNATGRTSLHEAVRRGKQEDVKFLIDRGCDVNAIADPRSGKDNITRNFSNGPRCLLPIHEALVTDDVAMVHLLASRGADVNLAPSSEWTPLDLALLNEHPPIMEVLFSHGGQFSNPLDLNADVLNDPEFLYHSALELLRVTTSGELIPPQECEPVYHYILSRTEFQHYLTNKDYNDLHEAKLLVNIFFDILYNLAQHSAYRPPSNQFCSKCLRFQIEASWPGPDFATLCRSSRPTFEIASNLEDLEESIKKGCPLCKVFSDAVDVMYSSEESRSFAKINKIDLLPLKVEIPVFTSPRQKDEISLIHGNASVRLATTYLNEETFSDSCRNDDDVTQGTASMKAFKVATSWIKKCQSSHSTCRLVDNEDIPLLPTRVIDVGTEETEPFLFEGHGKRSQYCALSYCWGTSPPLTTTKANVSAHMAGITLSSMPATLRDAIVSARGLGFRYIWIDALCIVQDDADDWDREAAMMQQIYAKAALTISSLASKNCSDGLFTPRRLRANGPIRLCLRLSKRFRQHHEFREPKYLAVLPLSGTWERGPVHSRGWTLQEQTLSVRILFYGRGMLHWQCFCLTTSEGDPVGSQRHEIGSTTGDQHNTYKKMAVRGLLTDTIPTRLPHQNGPKTYYEYWEDLLTEYSSKNLTKAADRLPAFAAISRYMERFAGSKITAGIWEGDHFFQCICWRVHESGEDVAGVPSWTWASMTGLFDYNLAKSYNGETITIKASLISFNVSSNKSESRVSGSMTLRGTIGKLNLKKLNGQRAFLDRKADFGVQECWFIEILAFGEMPREKLLEKRAYEMIPEPGLGKPSTGTILLQPADKFERKFRRIGFINIREADDENKYISRRMSDQIITIV